MLFYSAIREGRMRMNRKMMTCLQFMLIRTSFQ